MAQMRYHKFLRHSTYRRYGLFLFAIGMSLYSIQVYVNNINIDAQIKNVKQDIVNLEEENAFAEKFYKSYLQSEYASYFLGHESGIIYPREKIIRLTYQAPQQQVDEDPLLTESTTRTQISISTPQESWHHFIQTRLTFLKRRGIIK